MYKIRYLSYSIICLMLLLSCSVISKDIRYESNPSIRFKDLLIHPERYEGETVILGGYILEAKGDVETSTLTILQASLRPGDKPKARDYSEGRFTVLYDGFIDPEVYRKDRMITVAGRIIQCKDSGAEDCHTPYLKIESRELYLWPEYGYSHKYRYSHPYPHLYMHRYYRFPHHGFRYHHRYRYCL